jgi:hypothetical protein
MMPIVTALAVAGVYVSAQASILPASTSMRSEPVARCVPPGNGAVDLFLPGEPDPALTRLFTPQGAAPGTYCAVPFGASIDTLAREYAAREPADAKGAWRVRSVAPLDAFGSAAPYDRPTVAMLFGGKRIRLARGPVRRQGRVVASLTLASPYPDATLTRLMPGTLVIVFWIDDGR